MPMVCRVCPTNPREAPGLDPGAVHDHRQKADYGGYVSDIEVEPLFEDVEDFLTHMAELTEADRSADS
jgi:hypothetical protein